MNRQVRALVVVAFALGSRSAWPQEDHGSSLVSTVESLAANSWQASLSAAFGTFTYAYTDLPSPFSRWLEDELSGAIAQAKGIRLFNRAAAAAMDPAFRTIFGTYFRENGVDALLHGRFFPEGDSVRLRLELTGLSDGILIGTADARVPRSRIPPDIAVAPTGAVIAAAADLGKVLPSSPSGGLSVSLSTERGAGAAYREGEELVILATTNEEAYARIFHIDAKGEVQLIWPNRYGGNGRIGKGEVLRIPGPGDAFAFVMTPPYGTEFLKMVASSVPFPESGPGSPDSGRWGMGGGSSPPIAGGAAAPGPTSVRRAEALATYVIMPVPAPR